MTLLAFVNCRLVNPEFDVDTDALQEVDDDGGSLSTTNFTESTQDESEAEESFDSKLEDSSAGVSDSTTGDPDSTNVADADMASMGSNTEGTSSIESTSSSSMTTISSTVDTGSSGTDTEDLTTESDTLEDCTPTICLSYNDGDSADRLISPYGLLYAIPFSADADYTIVGAEVYTGAKSGMHGLGVWSSLDGKPIEELSAGTWMSDESVGWQGVIFSLPVDIFSGEEFFIVWDALVRSQGSIDSTGDFIVGFGSEDNGMTWTSQSWRWKVRVYCCDPNSL